MTTTITKVSTAGTGGIIINGVTYPTEKATEFILEQNSEIQELKKKIARTEFNLSEERQTVDDRMKENHELEQFIIDYCIDFGKGPESEMSKEGRRLLDLERDSFEVDEEYEHLERHKILHKNLDELVADFIGHTERLPSKTTLFEFMEWAYQQTIKADPLPRTEYKMHKEGSGEFF